MPQPGTNAAYASKSMRSLVIAQKDAQPQSIRSRRRVGSPHQGRRSTMTRPLGFRSISLTPWVPSSASLRFREQPSHGTGGSVLEAFAGRACSISRSDPAARS
jgi:hypothetical protein